MKLRVYLIHTKRKIETSDRKPIAVSIHLTTENEKSSRKVQVERLLFQVLGVGFIKVTHNSNHCIFLHQPITLKFGYSLTEYERNKLYFFWKQDFILDLWFPFRTFTADALSSSIFKRTLSKVVATLSKK